MDNSILNASKLEILFMRSRIFIMVLLAFSFFMADFAHADRPQQSRDKANTVITGEVQAVYVKQNRRLQQLHR